MTKTGSVFVEAVPADRGPYFFLFMRLRHSKEGGFVLTWLLFLTYPRRGNSARSALAGQGGGGRGGRCPLRPALPVALPTYYDCHRAPALWPLLQAVHGPPSFRFCGLLPPQVQWQ
jgi:hypothetical protein